MRLFFKRAQAKHIAQYRYAPARGESFERFQTRYDRGRSRVMCIIEQSRTIDPCQGIEPARHWRHVCESMPYLSGF